MSEPQSTSSLPPERITMPWLKSIGSERVSLPQFETTFAAYVVGVPAIVRPLAGSEPRVWHFDG